ncbi:homoserine dehydrogenase [Paenibacillus sp.]|uniref:homoserine dehydrogenase n=1 Tax=Paenibacillus sp. TaxID=58172 RepID=UPI002D33D0AF|nr:homoserine dehydrogenase [Paenibacillus sp.]HZG87036.1 homoserine dehydrogenase [Paenibacillus sp.]
METIRIGLMGLGTVGTGVVRILNDHRDDLTRQTGSTIEIRRVLVQNTEKPRDIALDSSLLTREAEDIVAADDIDVVVEVMGGVELTKGLIERALRSGKHVVTANKDLMALHGAELVAIAREHGCDIYYEASVAGGIPIIRALTESFSSDRIKRMFGIVNGTTNFILTKMSQEGASYEDVLKEAQALGYAEADPTSDVEGLDAARKMAILATLGFRMNVSLADVDAKGITGVTKEDIQYGKRLGYELKLLGVAERDGESVSVSVQPAMVRTSHPLASVNGVFNAVYVYGEAVGETMFYGPGAGSLPTATSVVADLVAVVKNMRMGVNGKTLSTAYKEKKLQSDDRIFGKFFLLLHVEDKAGVLAQITQAFAANEVSLESVLQQPNQENPKAEIIIITHDTNMSGMKNVIRELESMDVVNKIKSVYRVVG